jgi:catechol 2,3-dioxygenase-like lactoylglutathione lyase family enzyme
MAGTSRARTVDLKLEVVVIPVSDVDRAKRFYGDLGWRLDADFPFDSFRVVQFTPPGWGVFDSVRHEHHAGRTRLGPGSLSRRVRHRGGARRVRRSRRQDQRGVPPRKAWRSVPARGHEWPRQRARAPSRHVRLVRHLQRPGRQQLVAAGSHDAAARPNRRR